MIAIWIAALLAILCFIAGVTTTLVLAALIHTLPMDGRTYTSDLHDDA